MTDETPLLYETDGAVAIITMNRPDALNAISAKMREEFAATFAKVEADDEIRTVVLTANGRAFSAGTNLMEDFLPTVKMSQIILCAIISRSSMRLGHLTKHILPH